MNLGAIIKDFVTYSFGSIVVQVSNIALMLFLLYKLPAHDVGFFSVASASILYVSTLISCGLRQLFMFEFFNLDLKALDLYSIKQSQI